jgi:dihydrofolate reductase
MVRDVTYSLGMSLDGYIEGPDGDFQWSVPDRALFRHSIEEVRGLGVHLLGRRLYESMLYWEDVDRSGLDADQQEFADLWNALPKVVFSRSLTEVRGNARLASGTLAEEIERLRAEPGPGSVGIGGADLAAQVAGLGQIDEYLIRVFPVLVGGGKPLFARDEREVGLDLLDTRTFANGVLFTHYRVRR